MLDKVAIQTEVIPSNMNLAYKRVRSNKGSFGIDKLSTEHLQEWLLEHKESLIESLENGKYKPQAVRRVEIPKEGGKTRSLDIPQGGPLSPLLSNIMLQELDKELAKRGHCFVRYADDCLIFCKSKRACLRVKESITAFIESVLYPRVNKEKTTVGYIKGKKFFGYSFYNKSKGKWDYVYTRRAMVNLKTD
ncbi:reverse transcriptase domain-containing protein [Flavobacterium sp. LAR06]|uniref:reverse transcriptase domain-containing protein n=1 Tax=Flavobacterium sp. LAR06 TaxID=3064897 RepID=UPI0035BF15B7